MKIPTEMREHSWNTKTHAQLRSCLSNEIDITWIEVESFQISFLGTTLTMQLWKTYSYGHIWVFNKVQTPFLMH